MYPDSITIIIQLSCTAAMIWDIRDDDSQAQTLKYCRPSLQLIRDETFVAVLSTAVNEILTNPRAFQTQPPA